MLASAKSVADFSRGVQVKGSATYFSRPTPSPRCCSRMAMPVSPPGILGTGNFIHCSNILFLAISQRLENGLSPGSTGLKLCRIMDMDFRERPFS
jgi:hypothetical protein